MESSPTSDRRSLGDVLLVAGVYLLPNTYFAVAGWFQPAAVLPLAQSEVSLAVQAVAASALGVYLIARSGEPPAAFGLTRPRVSDFFFGLLLWLGLFLVALVIPTDPFGLPHRSVEQLFAPPRTVPDYLLVGVASCLNGFGEEVVMRAVLQTRLEGLMRSAPSAVVLASALFALYHVYYGVGGAVLTLVVGLILGVAFRWGGRLWPVVVAHALQDFLAMVLLADAAN